MAASLDTSLLNFNQNKLFKIMVCILELFGLFGPLFKKLGNFFPNHLVTLLIREMRALFRDQGPML
jgi:hypothetical protein